MSKKNESFSKDEKSSKLIIISKERIISAKNRVNYLTLKEGDLKLTVELKNDNLNKKEINKAVKSIKQQILINSKSYGSLYDKSIISPYLKNKKNFKSPINIKKEINSRKNPHIKKLDNIYIETTRSCNLMKTTENNKEENETDINKIETILPYENNENNGNNGSEDNLKEKNKNKKNKKIQLIKINEKNKTTNISENNNENDNDINNDLLIDNIPDIGIEIKENNNKINEDNIYDAGAVSRNYFNNTKNNKSEHNYDKYKSEEIKQLNSNSSRSKAYNYNNIQNNNYIEKYYQQSNKAAKSISDHEQDNKINNKISRLALDSLKIIDTDTYKEYKEKENKESKEKDIKDYNNNEKRLITEYDEDNIRNDVNELISESQSSKTIKVDENDEDDDQYQKIENNKNKDILNLKNNIINKEEKKILDNNNKENINKLKDEFNLNKKDDEENKNVKLAQSLPLRQHFNYVYKTCSICEHAYPTAKLYVASCNIHYLCRKCAKNFYEDLIENGAKEMLCPFKTCNKPIDIENIENLISKEHFNLLNNDNKNIQETQNKFCFTKLKSTFDQENLQLYTKKHVIDINNNKNFYDYNNIKGVFCPNCSKDSLFSKTNTYFFKCLNCQSKICRYCLKEYNSRHMDINSAEHCKVYYRFEDDGIRDLKLCYNFFMQLFFVFASYYLCFAGVFYFIRSIFFNIFCIRKNHNIFLYILSYLFTAILFVIFIPLIVPFYPFFPYIMAVFDY